MRYEDASQPDSAGHETVARPDVDTLPAGSFGPATGNAITGQGTSTGSSGEDSVAAGPATIVAVQGAGGPAVQANGAFQATGQYGLLSMDAQGNFNYVRNANTPDGVKDVFNYTLADAGGANASTTLTIDIAQVAAAAAGQGIVALPAGVELSDIHVNGRDLVINMPDGTQMVIPNGAVFVPDIMIGDVQVPPTNLAALLVDSEPQPAAGPPPSSGGNWNDPVPDLDPGAPLGDLIPPTELGHTPPVFQEPAQGIDTEPTVIIETPDFPAGAVDASESVSEKGLPARDGDLPNEPAGSGEIADGDGANNSDGSETNSGTIVFTAEDGLESVTINGTAVTAVGQQIAGQFGTLTITGIDLANGQITYSYTLGDNTSGNGTHDVFAIVVTDDDGDTASGSLTVNIVNDTPTARDDTDSTDLVSHVATGNVMTGADTTSGAAGADTVGADNAALSAVSSNGTGAADSSFDASGNLVVEGSFGTLTIKADGSYTYTAHSDAPGGSTDVFTYTLTDGDGDADTATLTITNPDHQPTVGTNAVVQLDDDALAGGNPGGPGDDPDSVNTTGTLSGSGGDGDLTFALTANGAPSGFTYQLQSNGDLWVMQGSTHVLTVTVDGATGAYSVTQVAPIDHPAGDTENNVAFDISYTVTDSDGDSVTGHLPVNVDDDTPIARNDTDAVASGAESTDGNVLTGAGTTSGAAGADSPGADGLGDGVIGIHPGTTGAFSDVTDSGTLVHGAFGDLVIHADGTYTYTLTGNAGAGGNDVFTYEIVDADGDVSTATLTITVPADSIPVANNATALVDDDGLPAGNHDSAPGDDTQSPDPDNDESTFSGTVTANFGTDGPGTFTFSADMDGKVVTIGQEQVTYHVVGDVLTAEVTSSPDAGREGSDLFTVTMNANGTYTVDLLENVLQVDDGTNTENNASADITFTAHDNNGDADNGTLTISFDDDIPVANPPGPPEQPGGPPAPLVYGLVDEDDLPEGNHDSAPGDDNPIDASGDSDPTTTGGAAGSLAALFSAGADQPLTFSLSDDTSGLPDLTSDGHAVLYSVENGVLTAVADINNDGNIDAGETTVFTLTVNADGSWSFNLEGQLDHPIAGTEDNLLLDLGSIITATDADGDSATAAPGAFIVNVDDDMPQPFDEANCPQVNVTNDAGSTADGQFDLPAIGADQPGTLSFGVTDGTAVLDSGGNPVTAEGQALFYFVNDAGVLEAREGGESGDIAFTITLNQNGSFEYHQLIDIDNGGGGVSFTDLTSTSAGNVEFRGVGADDAATTVDLLLSAEAGGASATVNTDSDSIGSANQSMDSGETVRIDFVTNLVTGASTPSQFGYDGHVESNSFTGLIPQVQGSQSETVAFTAWALESSNTSAVEPDRDPTGGFSDSTITPITSVTVTDYLTGQSTTVDVTGFTVGDFTDLAYGISVRVNGDGSVTFAGIQQGDSYGFNTDSGNFNAVAVQAEPAGTGGSTEDSFDLGVFSIGTANAGEPVDFTVPVVLTDADGDPVTCDIDISLNPAPIAPESNVTVNEAGLDLIGSDGGSNSEMASGDLSTSVSGEGPFTFAFASGEDGNGAHGTLVLNPDGTFTYTLTSPVDSSPDANDGTNPETGQESFTYTVTDANGVTTTGTLNVTIIDDVPTASADTNSVDEGSTLIVNAASGVESNDVFGADGKAAGGGVTGVEAGSHPGDVVTTGVGSAIAGTYGTLTLNADGSYTYQATANSNPPADATDVFTYTITDGDGDMSTATLTIDVNDVDLSPNNQTQTVYEAALDLVADDRTGTLNDDLAAGSVEGSDPTSAGETVSGQLAVAGATTYVIVGSETGNYGEIHINADGSYTYTLTDPVDNLPHANDGNDTEAGADVFTYQADDGHGNTVTGTITIDVVDDVPTASASLNSGSTVSLDESGPGAAATIGLSTYTAGNDEDVSGSGPISRAVSGSAVIAPTIVYGADGPAANQPVYALDVTNASSGLTTTEGEAITLVQLNSTTILGIVAAGGEHANEVAFAIQIGSDGKVTTEQYLSLDHPVNPDPNDVLQLDPSTIAATVSATDSDGDMATSAPVDISGQISFYDDGPTLGAFTDANVPNEVGHVDGTYVFDWGADGLGGLTVTGPVIDGITYAPPETASDGSVTLRGMSGTTEVFNLVVHPDGTYTFNLVTPDAGETHIQTLLNIASGQNEFIQTPDGLIEFTPLDHDGNDTGTVNSSGAGFGNQNQFTGNGEAVTFEFHSQNDAGDTAVGTHPQFVSEVTLDVPSNGFNGTTELITWYATNTETGETATGTIAVDTSTEQLVFDPGFDFNVLTIEGSDADGNGIRMTQITTVTRILPQDQDLDFTIQATDGDGDPTGTSTLSVHINADSTLQANTLMQADSVTTSLETSSLVSSNDNHRSFDTDRALGAGHNAAVMAALAAVGLEADHMRIDLSAVSHASNHSPELTPLHTAALAPVSVESSSSLVSSHLAEPLTASHGVEAAAQAGSHFNAMAQQVQSLSHGDVRHAPAATELLHGSDAPAHGPAAHASAVTAAAVAMPSAAQLAAAAGAHAAAKGGDGAEHNAVVSKVLADSLNGGEGHGPNIDALLAAHGGHSGAPDLIEALASHGAGGVPYGHSGGSSAIAMAHSMFSMAMMHHDAAPPAHG